MPRKELDHDPTLDELTGRRIERLEKAVFGDGSNVVPLTPLPNDMAAHLAAFNQRVEHRLAEVSSDMAAVKGSDDLKDRLEALETHVEKQFAHLGVTLLEMKR